MKLRPTKEPKKGKQEKAGANAAKEPDEPRTIKWTLTELPSAQHRAGLAGLVLMVDYARRSPLPEGAYLEKVALDDIGFELKANLKGLSALIDVVYAASLEEIEVKQQWKKKGPDGNKIPVEPKRRLSKTIEDKKGKKKEVEFFVYDITVPRGGLIGEWAPTSDNGVWLKLWREWLWASLRAIPKQRTPYTRRAAGDNLADEDLEGVDSVEEVGKDAQAIWKALIEDSAVPLASTFFMGAMDESADLVPFKDQGRYQFLLHFWPFTIHLFVPQFINADGDTRVEEKSYVACIPDVVRLERFAMVLPRVMRQRSPDAWGFRPKQALVDLAAAAAFTSERWLQEQVSESLPGPSRVVAGFQVVHSEKKGNSVHIRLNRTIEATTEMLDAARIVDRLWSHLARHQVLSNALEGNIPDRWWFNFGRVCATRSWDLTIKDRQFRHDAKELFDHFHPERDRDMQDPSTERPSRGVESLVLHLVQAWLSGRLAAKHDLRWLDVRDDPRAQEDFEKKRHKLAIDAFLAARSRPEHEFGRWFTSTLCSVSHRMSDSEFIELSRALDSDPERVRALTLLALSARG
jgi:CRISPR-associated protein Cmx8